ncbi:M23 family metallopeptidase [Flavobacterium gelidilacus]|jgi:murein DD-endopeptidase MepM/ murein hydrolase activator NlpD|uniref:murein hydrolase activator EnvC family protein n=1 Tax=Flavobacterium gelidilacus TaxID=206041 RepID=UPI00041B1B48|nr:M23 family metallopeptidase [Flavobacterium gelidilacus]
MSKKRIKRQLLKNKLFNKRRLVILNEDTFEETFSLKLNLMNVFVGVTLSAIFLISITTYIIAFTPLREYIPGYASTKLKQDAIVLAIKSDSLQSNVELNNKYIASIKKVLIGELEYAKLNKDSLQNNNIVKPEDFDVKTTKEEQELRDQVAKEDKYNVFDTAKAKVNFVLFPPTNGKIIKNYNPAAKNYGIEIAIAKDTPIKAVASGTILFADWTPTTGYVVIIKHKDELISVYKNISFLTKSVRDNVRTGEVIGQAGSNEFQNNSGNFYFELWKEGFPINPTQFINF